MKVHKKWLEKNLVKTTTKKDKKMIKRVDSFEASSDAETSMWMDHSKEQAGELSTMGEEVDGHGEDADTMVDGMVEGTGGEGLASALEAAEQVEDFFYMKMDNEMEGATSTALMSIDAQMQALSTYIKETYVDLEEDFFYMKMDNEMEGAT